MIYLDSSSLLKLLWEEPESAAVRAAVTGEDYVAISTLAELEVEVQLRAKWLGGGISNSRYEKYRKMLTSFRSLLPFRFCDLPGTVFREATRQHIAGKTHCRSLDRIHLAAIEELGLRRLMTNDIKQATAAREMGYAVVHPHEN